MHVYKCKKINGEINLNVHSDIKRITKGQINDFEWVPADVGITEKDINSNF